MRKVFARLSLALCFFSIVGHAQDHTGTSQDIVFRGRGYVTDPIRIVAILYQGRAIQPDTPFPGGENWLQDLSIQVQNVSGKTLTHASIQIVFPSLGRPMLFHFASVGQFPEHRRQKADGSIEPDHAQAISIGPCGKFMVPIGPFVSEIRTVLSGRANLSDIHTCTIGLNQAYFSDGTMWSLQTFFRESADDTNNYVRISPEAFYGVQATTLEK